MKKLTGIVLGAGILFVSMAAGAATDNKAKAVDRPKDTSASVQTQAPAQALSPQDQAKQQVVNDLAVMQNVELRVIVLQQVLNREVAELRQVQAVFCDAYKLDVEKWRKGLYRYDEKQSKFIEVPETPKTK